MTRIIDNMVGKGCIEGVKNRRDGGVMNVPLIRRGREMPKELGGPSQQYVESVLRHKPQEKIAKVVESLKRIIRSVEKEVQEEGMI